jgi:hypothetical protein
MPGKETRSPRPVLEFVISHRGWRSHGAAEALVRPCGANQPGRVIPDYVKPDDVRREPSVRRRLGLVRQTTGAGECSCNEQVCR